jgi:trans-aconitate methyltransferase
MGKSSKEGKDIIVQWVNDCNISTALDIGAGSGTYRKLFSKNKLHPDAKWTAIEAWEPYIKDFNLHAIYNNVIHSDVRNCDIKSLGNFDITFMGDVLEHITKEDAILLVDAVMSISKYAVISIPIIHWPQGERHGNPFEIHVKDDWSDSEVKDTFSKYITRYAPGDEIGVYWLESK